MAPAHSSHFAFGTFFQRVLELFLWLLLAAAANTQNGTGEVETLMAFRSMSNLLSSHFVEYWLDWNETDANPCSWVGVTCTANYTVEDLDFSGWGMSPYAPSFEKLSNLPDLSRLDLSSNGAPYFEVAEDQGTEYYLVIPDVFSGLTGLTHLDLSQDNYRGKIPSNVSACKSLRYLSVEQNLLDGEISGSGGLKKLQVLHLANNQFSGQFPKDLGEMLSIVTVDLSNNRLNGTIPDLSNLTRLLDLRLDNNGFTGFEESSSLKAMSLKSLSISGNRLEGTIPQSVTEMVNLTFLDLSRNRLSGKIPSGFFPPTDQDGYSTNTFHLDLSENFLGGPIPPGLLQTNTSSFRFFINFSQNSLIDHIPDLWHSPSEPRSDCEDRPYAEIYLDLSYNHLSGTIPPLHNNTILISLHLHHNQLYGDIFDFLADNVLFLDNCDIWSFWMFIEELQLQNNLFTGDFSRIAYNWSRWLSLEVLDLRYNNLHWSTEETIYDPLSVALASFPPTLREIRLGGNDFSGIYLPTALPSNATLSTVEVLDFSSNQLRGEISGAVFNNVKLPSLQFLNLSNNDATGPIPEELIFMTKLTRLDVSNNNLSGSLSFIKPSNPLYNPRFFAKNSGLCDGPLPPCRTPSILGVISRWVLLITIGGSMTIVMGSCLAVWWRWRVYQERHRQDEELINTLLEGESATLMSLRELKKATDNFAESAQIGEGGFGKVYKGKLHDGTLVAIKRSKHEGFGKYKQQFLNEVRILSQVNHRSLVELLGCCMENKIGMLVFEFVSNGTLQEHLQGKFGPIRLSWKHRLKIAVQTSDALNYLHSATVTPIIHRDVKSANILLNGDLHAKVADFGISKLVPTEATHVSTMAIEGTMGYIDPEYYTSFQLTDRSDVYSFGVVLLELLSAKPVIDFARGGDETSLVIFADPHVKSGDLQQLLDPTLAETYNDPTGHGKESILNVGRLAMKCVDMRSKVRPSMKEVWKDLETLWLALVGTSRLVGSVNEDDNNGPQHNAQLLEIGSSPWNWSDFNRQNDDYGMEMSQRCSR